MRRAIADSDDDEDDLTSNTPDRDIAVVLPGNVEMFHREGVMENDDQTLENSTGSTERLREKIRDAEKRLLTNSAPEAMDGHALISSSSPSIQANKRRTASVLASQISVSAERSVKRSKTLKTYSARKLANLTEDSGIERPKDGETVPKTSQSARFTEHSGVESSVVLPSGSIQEGFMEHEPSVLFRDSGSTLADTSSVQQRLLEQALGAKGGQDISPVNAAISDDQQNSSLPWSALEPNGSLETNSMLETAQTGVTNEDSRREDAAASDIGNAELMNRSSKVQERPIDSSANPAHKPASTDWPSNLLGSPAVEIRLHESDMATTAHEASAITQRAQQGHKRKAEEEHDTGLLISDDRPIDLPPEQYKPRPSKRRATHIVEDPIDYSVRPEKAAKVKRTKSMQALGRSSRPESDPAESITVINAKIAVSGAEGVGNAPDSGIDSAAKISSDNIPSPRKRSEDIPGVNDEYKHTEQNSTQKVKSPEIVAEQNRDEKNFLKPAKSTQKTKSASKTKRSQTTIFEDHVDFKGSHTLPSLTQQQSTRHSALQTVQNDATKSRRKRRNIVTDEDDDDEVIKEVNEAAQEHTSPPKKKQRGRPPKSNAKAQTETDQKALEQSHVKEDEVEVDDAPKKRGRGRPSKTSDADASTAEPKDQINHSVQEEHSQGDAEIKEAGDISGASNMDTTSTKLPTPSPEKKSDRQKAAKPSPTSHSPIKSTLKVPLRVGLSNRHRIPSLLRTMNPKR